MATISDVETVLRLISRNISEAEHEKIKALQVNTQLDESIQRLDNLRRNIVFVNRGYEDLVSLASVTLEIERTKRLLDISKMKIKQSMVSAVAHIVTLYHFYSLNGEFVHLVRLGNSLRQIASILRYTRDINVDYSELISMTAQLESEIILKSTIKTSSESYFFQQLKPLNSTFG